MGCFKESKALLFLIEGVVFAFPLVLCYFPGINGAVLLLQSKNMRKASCVT